MMQPAKLYVLGSSKTPSHGRRRKRL